MAARVCCGEDISHKIAKAKYCSDPHKRQDWRVKNAYRQQGYQLARYGISVADYDALLASQGGACAICDASPVLPSVDHDHGSGRVRGILCRNHNAGLGMFGDDPALLRTAARYLEDADGRTY